METVRNPMLVLDAELRLKTANKAFYKSFPATPGDLTGQSVFRINGGRWDQPELRARLTALLTDDTAFEDFAVAGDFPGAGKLTMLINARRMVSPQTKTVQILMAFETVSSPS